MLRRGLEAGQIVVLGDEELSMRVRNAPSPLLEELESGNESRRRSRLLRAEILSLAPAERRTTMPAFVCDALAGVQGLSEEQRAALDVESPLDSLGLDSLMTMELFMGMGRELELAITVDWFEAGPTLRQIAEVLVERLEEAVTGGDSS
jgi:acyl carrier protein